MKIYHIDRKIRNESNFPFWFSMIKEAIKIIDFNRFNSVIDFGCGRGGLSQLIHQAFAKLSIFGIEIDYDLLLNCQQNNRHSRINYLHYNELSTIPKADLVFSQEVVYTQKSLSHHANEIFNILHDGGHYIFTMGCHIENPTWAKRRDNIRSNEKYCAFDYSIEDVANAFFDAGFRVTAKKLPIDVPMKYVPRRGGEFSSLSDMLRSSEEYKYLFVMLKPTYSGDK
jgi:SAM-dependent methyltransferase